MDSEDALGLCILEGETDYVSSISVPGFQFASLSRNRPYSAAHGVVLSRRKKNENYTVVNSLLENDGSGAPLLYRRRQCTFRSLRFSEVPSVTSVR